MATSLAQEAREAIGYIPWRGSSPYSYTNLSGEAENQEDKTPGPSTSKGKTARVTKLSKLF